MDTTSHRHSAEIIPFPSRARARVVDAREAPAPTVFPALRTMRVASVSGWYHEAAIREAEAEHDGTRRR